MQESSMKVCSKCNENKSIDSYNTYKYKPKNDGSQTLSVRSYCKVCQYVFTKKFFDKNQGYKKQWRLKNTEKVKGENLRAKPRTDRWRIENKEVLKIKKAIYKTKNRQHISEWNRKDRDRLSDYYVCRLINRRRSKFFKLSDVETNRELIETYKLIIKTKRLCKTLQNSDKV